MRCELLTGKGTAGYTQKGDKRGKSGRRNVGQRTVPCPIVFSLGIMDASWRNEKYEINETGIFIKGLTQKKDVHWDSIRSCGVFPIKMIPSGMPRDYIVFFLSDYRPSFPVDLAFCSIHRRKMLVIRATTERIEEIKKSTTRHHIIWKNANDGYGTWDGQ